jgi:hypothetical protein
MHLIVLMKKKKKKVSKFYLSLYFWRFCQFWVLSILGFCTHSTPEKLLENSKKLLEKKEMGEVYVS